MEYALLGDTDLRVSRVGFGCAAIGGHDYGSVNDDTSVAAIERALELGINFFDVADVYGFGHAEAVLGRAIAGKHDRAIVATKVGVRWDDGGRTWRDLSRAWVTKALEGSLRRLKLDFIHLYQIHWPDPATPISEVIAVLEEFRASGKVGYIGCCNFTQAELDLALGCGPVKSIQFPLNILDRSRVALAEYASERGLGVQCYDVLARGLLTGKYDGQARFEGTDSRPRSDYFKGQRLGEGLHAVGRLKSVGDAHGCKPAQVAARWVLDQSGVTVALTGIKTPEQAADNAGAVGCGLTPDEARYLETGR